MKRIYILISTVLFITGAGNAQYSDLFDFNGSNGGSPNGSLTLSGYVLYGMTQSGSSGKGNIFSINQDGSGFTSLFDFNGSNGSNPLGSLTLSASGNVLYGMTNAGGTNNAGTIFSINTDGAGYKKLFDFKDSSGAAPRGSLILSGNTLFGMTYNGGLYDNGVVFSINTDGTGFKKLLDFDGTNGAHPAGDLLLVGNTLYGTTSTGGPDSVYVVGSAGEGYQKNGVIFSVNADGSGYKILHDFNNISDDGSFGTLTLAGTKLFGMEKYKTGHGQIFSINTDGTGYNALQTIDPPGNSLLLAGNVLYGLSPGGHYATNYYGSIFSINTDGSGFNYMFDFMSGIQGAYPEGALIISGNKLYGMGTGGGASGNGVVFSYDLNTNGIKKSEERESILTVFPNPSSERFTFQSSEKISFVTITNPVGEKIYAAAVNSKQETINLSSQPKGIYFAEIISGNQKSCRKIIIE